MEGAIHRVCVRVYVCVCVEHGVDGASGGCDPRRVSGRHGRWAMGAGALERAGGDMIMSLQ